MVKPLTLSLVIPVYNEERHIKACLDSIAGQSVMPDEVLVIDNNCIDKTVELAKKYKFVRIIHEPTQGIIAARNSGFDHASGDILGRINADARLDKNWVALVKDHFLDRELVGLTGLAQTDALPFSSPIKTSLWSHLYFLWREASFGHRILWGGNMAIRRSVWENIRRKVCLEDSLVHEDQDVSSLIVHYGGNIQRDNKLMLHTDGREYNNWPKFYEYSLRAHKTKLLHYFDLHTNQAEITRLRFWQRAWRYGICLLPGSIFIIVSLAIFGLKLITHPK